MLFRTCNHLCSSTNACRIGDVQRHINTDSDSELLLNVFAEGLTAAEKKADIVETVFGAIEAVMRDCKGGYAGMYLINGIGLVGFRDPHGIRPLVFGTRKSKKTGGGSNGVAENGGDQTGTESVPSTPARMSTSGKTHDYVMASESVAIDTLGFTLVR